MSRLTEAILSGSYATGKANPMLDLTYGGQHGWAPDLSNLVSNQAYVSRPLSCILLEAPKMFTVLPESQKWISSLKALFELHARTIDGMNASLKVDTDDHPVGGAGEIQQEVVNVTRERSAPRFTFIEKYGRPIQTLLDWWIRYGHMDPESKFALLGTLGQSGIEDLLLDWNTATCLFFVADSLHQKVDKAWISANMYPLTAGDVTAKRDLTTSQEILTLDVEFAAVSQTGLGVVQFAQQILDSINIANADPNMQPSFVSQIASDVSAQSTSGYSERASSVGREAVVKL